MKRLFVLLFFMSTLADAETKGIHLGVSIPLTGDLAEYGSAVRNGFLLSSADHPSSGVHLTFEDNRYDARTAVTAYRKLVDQSGADLIFSWGEGPLHAVAPLAEREQIPLLAMSVDAEPARGKQYTLLVINHPREYVDVLLRYLRARSFKRIGLVVTEDPFMSALVQEIRKALRSDEMVEILGTILPGDSDLKATMSRVKQAKIDVLGVYLLSGQVQSLYRAMKAAGVQLPTFGTDVFESKSEIAGANGAMHGAVYPNLLVPRDFYDRYVQKFGHDSQIAYAFNAFIIGNACMQLIKKESSRDPINLLQHFTLPSTRGSAFKFIDDGQGERYLQFPLVMRTVDGRGFVDVESE